MASAVSVHLAALFPGTAPEVVEAENITPVEKSIWKPVKGGSYFWVETVILEECLEKVIVRTRLFFGGGFYGVVEKARVVFRKKVL